jgi:hypothetical protein
MNLGTIKIGDEVGFVRYGNYGISMHGFGNVHKINKDGGVSITDTNGETRRFTKDGRQVAKSEICLIAAGILRERLAERDAQRATNRAYAEFSGKFETVRQNHRNGYGDQSPMTAAEYAELVDLLHAIPHADAADASDRYLAESPATEIVGK